MKRILSGPQRFLHGGTGIPACPKLSRWVRQECLTQQQAEFLGILLEAQAKSIATKTQRHNVLQC